MDRVRHDLRIALRGFRRSPSFTITAVLILAIGIGMAVAMFTVFDAVVVRPLPVTNPDKVVELYTYRGDPNADFYLLRGDIPNVAATSKTMRDIGAIAHWGAPPSPYARRRSSARAEPDDRHRQLLRRPRRASVSRPAHSAGR